MTATPEPSVLGDQEEIIRCWSCGTINRFTVPERDRLRARVADLLAALKRALANEGDE